ncbi:hypothetical protein V8E54_006224 [Elaphomyces granulatus]
MVSKARREHLKRARSLAQQRREELRIEALVQGHEDALLEIVGNDQEEEGDEREEEVEEQTDQTFYWDSSATETDTESEPDVESELNNEIESLPTNEQSRSASGTFGQLPLRWNQDAGKNLRGAYGSGSRSTHKRERRIESVSVPHSLGEFHAHNFAHAISPPLHEDLKHLLRRVSDQEKKYGEQLNINELAVIVPFLLLKVQGRGMLLDAGSFSGRYRGFKIGSFHEGAKVVVEVPG